MGLRGETLRAIIQLLVRVNKNFIRVWSFVVVVLFFVIYSRQALVPRGGEKTQNHLLGSMKTYFTDFSFA